MDWHYWGTRIPPGMARRYQTQKSPDQGRGFSSNMVP
jgi:hypothetical protein